MLNISGLWHFAENRKILECMAVWQVFVNFTVLKVSFSTDKYILNQAGKCSLTFSVHSRLLKIIILFGIYANETNGSESLTD